MGLGWTLGPALYLVRCSTDRAGCPGRGQVPRGLAGRPPSGGVVLGSYARLRRGPTLVGWDECMCWGGEAPSRQRLSHVINV